MRAYVFECNGHTQCVITHIPITHVIVTHVLITGVRTRTCMHAEGRPSHVDANSDAVTHEGIVKAYTDYFLLGMYTVLVGK